MKQLVQSIRSGQAAVVEVPSPSVDAGQILVQVQASLVSAGTERMIVDFAEKNLLQKARSRPDLVRQTVDKARREGVLTTLEAVQNRLDRPMALGYACAGTVIAVGADVTGFETGDRVACAGAGYAVHAELIAVPQNLAVKLPEGAGFEAAAFTTLGAIALQGIRLADAKLGERVAVIGLGLLGQLTVQMLKAAGCIVVGMDIQPQRAELALQSGADLVVTTAEQLTLICQQLTDGVGVDSILITADTKSNQPIELAGEIAREQGVVVAVGAVGMTIPRKVYYEKELDFRISRSYGPGRYDVNYEERGQDYPIAYVRWTENRNMQAFVQLVASGRVDIEPLITHRFPIAEATDAYNLIMGKQNELFLGVLIVYSATAEMAISTPKRRLDLAINKAQPQTAVSVGLLGAGLFATAVLLPAMQKIADLNLQGVCTATGFSARHTGDKFDFGYCTTDEAELLNDPQINTIAIATRHHLHAAQIQRALTAGKHVFCEKPLALNEAELGDIITCQQKHPNQLLLIGFNRRFAPLAQKMKQFAAEMAEPLVMHYRVNAGFIPADHWVHDPKQGGGRIIGEVCHFVDFLTYLAGSLPISVQVQGLANNGRYQNDNLVTTLTFANGSIGTITYVANGDKSFGKEHVTVFGGGCVATLDDYRRLELVRNGRKQTHNERWRQDKGHQGEWESFVQAIKQGQSTPIPLAEIIAATLATFRMVESLRQTNTVLIDTQSFIDNLAKQGVNGQSS